jgi:hypothetical protein
MSFIATEKYERLFHPLKRDVMGKEQSWNIFESLLSIAYPIIDIK